MAGLFYELKCRKIKCDIALEYAKELVWGETYKITENPYLVFSNQLQRLVRLNGKVDVIITDSSLLHSIIYDAKDNFHFKQVILNEYNKFNNLNFFITKIGDYNHVGRVQDENEAKKLSDEIEQLLIDENIMYRIIPGKKENLELIVNIILNNLR